MGQLDGKVVFVTGAARGQGRSHAIRLAQEGASIIGFDVCGEAAKVQYRSSSPEDLKETERLVDEVGYGIVTVIGDVRFRPSAFVATATCAIALGPIPGAKGNAGTVSGRSFLY
jgi:NAD(P)-dependent dehydrogenase (short-subunit alcohol dehydrogenase family)